MKENQTIAEDGLSQRRFAPEFPAADPISGWWEWDSPSHPALKPDEVALHDVLLGMANRDDPSTSYSDADSIPSEVFLG